MSNTDSTKSIVVEFVRKVNNDLEVKKAIIFEDIKSANTWLEDVYKFDKGQTIQNTRIRA